MPRTLIRLLRLFATVVALLQGVTPAATAVAEGTLSDQGRKNPALVHIEDARQGTCAYAHAEDCAVCGCVAAFPLLDVGRPAVAAVPARLVPPGEAPVDAALGARAPPSARAPPAV
jgi:hypothetical protein